MKDFRNIISQATAQNDFDSGDTEDAAKESNHHSYIVL